MKIYSSDYISCEALLRLTILNCESTVTHHLLDLALT